MPKGPWESRGPWKISEGRMSLRPHCPVLNAKTKEVVWKRGNLHLGKYDARCGVEKPNRHLFLGCLGSCAQLRLLDLSACDTGEADDSVMRALAAHCTLLSTLVVPDSAVTDVGVTTLAGGCTRLSRLNVSCSLGSEYTDAITDEALSGLAASCPRLSSLNLCGRSCIGNGGVHRVASACGQLESLELGRCDVNDRALAALAHGCPSLTHLGLSHCVGVTDCGLERIAHCTALASLDVSQCDGVSDDGLAALGLGACVLSRLDVSGSAAVTGSGLEAMAELAWLNMSRCTAISARGLQAIAAGCQQLSTLRLDSAAISDDGMFALKRLRRLTAVSVNNCSLLSDESLGSIAFVLERNSVINSTAPDFLAGDVVQALHRGSWYRATVVTKYAETGLYGIEWSRCNLATHPI